MTKHGQGRISKKGIEFGVQGGDKILKNANGGLKKSKGGIGTFFGDKKFSN